jgi:hypothetical protein
VRALPFVAALLVLAEAAGAIVFCLTGPWPLGVLLAVAAVSSLVIGVQVRRAGKKRPQAMAYVDRERVGY